ncbi:MAG: Fur family transcriptional regulator [Paludibacter sp.]|jgi:Fur family transcriptional regulator, ferric uptake regulator
MKEEVSFEAVKEIFTEYLKEHKHRKTPERYAILERINAFEGHFNAEVLYNIMLTDYRVSLATVYNTLELLLDCKLIIKHQLGGQFAQYEKAFGNNTHNHLICTSCGKVKEFTDKQLRISIQSRKFAHFYSTHYTLYLYGLCHKCKAKLKNTES